MQTVSVNYSGAGVYGIKNIKSDKMYIGSSGNVGKRLRQHFRELDNGNHVNKMMQADYSKGDPFVPVLIRKIAVNVREELFNAEGEVIAKMKQDHVELYNSLPVCGNYYISRSEIERKFVDLFCREHFGMASEYFFGRTIAAYNMMYEIFLHPEDEEKLREKYEPAINYQNRNKFYRRAGLSYDEFLELPEEEQIRINKKLTGR